MPNFKTIPNETLAKAQYESGVPMNVIAFEQGVSEPVIRRIARQQSWERMKPISRAAKGSFVKPRVRSEPKSRSTISYAEVEELRAARGLTYRQALCQLHRQRS